MKYGIFCFIALTVLLSACIGVSDGPTSELETQGDTITPPQKSMDGGKTMVEKASDTLSDIKAAMASGLGYKCVYSFEGTTAETMVMGENFRSKTKTEGFEINTLSDGIWIYTWIGGESTGTKFRVAD